MTKPARIAVIAGDGIGPEVTEQAVRVADAAARIVGDTRVQWDWLPWNSAHYFAHGKMMPENGIELLRDYDAIFLGAVGDPRLPDHVTLNGLLLPIRRAFDQYINMRPNYLFEGVQSPLRDKPPGSIDLVIFRENTEGEYADVGGRVYRDSPHDIAVQSAVFTRRGTERIVRAAFDHARSRRRHVTSITKSNAQGYSMVLWDEVFVAVSKEYPDVATRSLLVDAAAMELIRRPETFDVIVASNLFGDILSEIGAIIVGTIGLAASANINPQRTGPSMFEPVHGSAPDIAGKGIANPLAAILAAEMMFNHLTYTSVGQRIRAGVATVLRQQQYHPSDLGGTANTTVVAQAVIDAMQ